MKNLVLGMSVLFAGACNVSSSLSTATEHVPGSTVVVEKPQGGNPLAKSLKQQYVRLLASIDSVDALARTATLTEADTGMSPATTDAGRDAAVAAWFVDAHRYRLWVDTHPVENKAPDSLTQSRMASADSIVRIVRTAKAEMAHYALTAEVRNIDARLVPSASFKFQGAHYSAIKIDPKKQHLDLHWKNPSGSKYLNISNLKTQLEKDGEKVVMITNAGMYNPDNSPQGLYIEDGKELVPLDTGAGPAGRTLNFYLMPNGVFYLDGKGAHVDVTDKFPKKRGGIQLATQSGPMLVIDGELHPKFTKGSTNTNIRSGVGITPDGKVVIAISDQPVNFWDFATLFKVGLHCEDALYLDGAISQMFLPKTDRVDMGGDFGPILSVTE